MGPDDPRASAAQLIDLGVAELRDAGIEVPRLEAALLLAHACGTTREQLLANPGQSFSAEAAARYRRLVARRAGHEPLAYITGHREFMSLEFEVTSDVLVPRPDTELLCEQALAYLRTLPRETLAVTDVGTGSGALAVAIAHGDPRTRVYAVDISPRAAAVARRNVQLHRLEARVSVLTGDLLGAAGLPAPGDTDLVVANLPYVPAEVLAQLAPEIAYFEPRLALDGGADGLDPARRLLPQAWSALGEGGAVGLECDPAQCRLLTELAERAGFTGVTAGVDLGGHLRTVWGYKRGHS